MPDYEEAIAQSMKQPPPPYYQVAMATNHPTSNRDDHSAGPLQSEACHFTDNIVVSLNSPPGYDESNNLRTVSLAPESVPNTLVESQCETLARRENLPQNL